MKDYEYQKAPGGISLGNENAAGLSSAPGKRKKLYLWIAAALILILSTGAFYFLRSGWPSGTGSNGNDANEDPEYMYYTGPVFPLSLEEADDDISSDRDIHFDFSPFRDRAEVYMKVKFTGTEVCGPECLVSDLYTLSNHSGTDKTLQLLYPFAAGLISSPKVKPVISVNGSPVEAECITGPASEPLWSGTYRKSGDLSYELSKSASWERYRDVIESGYQASAFDSFPEIRQPVTVYEIKNINDKESYEEDEDDEEDNDSTLYMEFPVNYEQTSILTFGFNSYHNEMDTEGNVSFGSVDYMREDHNAYLLVIGKDIENYRLTDDTEETGAAASENADVRVVRYETDMDTMFREFSDLYWKENEDENEDHINDYFEDSLLGNISQEEFNGLVFEMMHEQDILTDSPGDIHDYSRLEDLFSAAFSLPRIMYLKFQVTVPAGSSVSVSADMVKLASMDLSGSQKARNGYDMVTRLGSSLEFTGQTASLSGTEYIKIIRQNFGFAPEKGIDEVTLDLNEPHYYIEVRKKNAK